MYVLLLMTGAGTVNLTASSTGLNDLDILKKAFVRVRLLK